MSYSDRRFHGGRSWCPKAVGRGLAVLMFGAAACPGCIQWLGTSLIGDGPPIVFNDSTLEPVLPVSGGQPVFNRRPVVHAAPEHAGVHAATITVFPDGELLAAWYAYSGPHELDGSAIYMSRRSPGQEDWQTPWLHIDRPVGDGNPVLYSEGERVLLFQAVVPGLWSTAHIAMQDSADRGKSWSEPVALPGPVGANVRFPPVRTATGDLLLPAYDDLLQRSLMYASADGRQWTLLGAIATTPPAIQPSVAVLPEGRFVAVMRNTEKGWLWVMGSSDGGRTWSEPQDSGFPNPASPAAIVQLAGGNLLLVYNDSPAERVRLTAALSADGGATWPCRRLLVDGTENCSYPSVIQTSDGLVHILFSVGRKRIDHIACNEAWIIQGSPGD